MAPRIVAGQPQGALKSLLANWPAGTLRLIEHRSRTAPARLGDWRDLVRSGFVQIEYEADEALLVKRTDKVVVDFKPRGPELRSVWPWSTLWPWSAEEHWLRVAAHPFRAASAALDELEPADLWKHSVLYPVVIHSQAQLKCVRYQIRDVFVTPEERPQVRSEAVRPYLTNGPMLRYLLLEMLVEPLFTDGAFTRFVPVDPAAASEEMMTWLGDGELPSARYLSFMQSNMKEVRV